MNIFGGSFPSRAEKKTIDHCIRTLEIALQEVESKYRSNEGSKMAYGYTKSIELLRELTKGNKP